MRVSDYTEAPYQGVSQAPAQVRLSTQATAIEDWSLNVPSGAQPRAPFELITLMTGLSTNNLQAEFIRKSGVGDFVFNLQNILGVVTPRLHPLLNGNSTVPLTVEPAAQAYLNSGDPSPDNDLRMLTVEDFTFILNRKVQVANGVATSPARPLEGMLWVRQAAYARTYTITVTPAVGTPVTATLTTPSGKDASDGEDVDTTTIVSGLTGGTYPVSVNGATNGGSTSGDLTALTADGYTVTVVNEIIYISHPTVDFTMEVSDGQGGAALIALKDRVQAFSDLPKKCPIDGFVLRVTQQTGDEQDDFFVRFRQTAGAGTGVWEETIGPGANLGVDPETMPVALVYDYGLGTWTVKVLDWTGRTVGDEELVADPGYVGSVLQDITFWKGRLGLLYSEGLRLSSATDPLRMYPSTLTQVQDDDAVEVINPLTEQADFRYALPFKTRLIMWGLRGQAQVTASGGQTLTPKTVDADPYSAYEFNGTARPQSSNDRIYFLAPRGANASAVYEMEVQLSGQSEVQEGDDMSVSLPRYIPASINRATTCPVQYLSVYGVSGATGVIPHLYRYADRQRAQNAFSTWNLPAGCTYAGGFFDNTRFYCLVLRDGQVYLLRADTADGVTDPGSEMVARIDLRLRSADLVVTYDSGTDRTTIQGAYPWHSEPVVMVTAPGGVGGEMFEGELLDAPEGTVPEVGDWLDGSSTFTLVGDWTQAPLLIGEMATQNIITLSPIMYRDANGRPDRSGRLVIKKLILDLDRTAYLKVRVKVGGRAARVMTFESPLWDTPSQDYDKVNLYSGEWSVPVGGSANETTIDIYTDKPLPASVLGYTWEGEINPKAKRITTG